MPKADILFDKTEFVLRMADKQAMTMNIRADQITTITFQPTMQKKLFKKIPSDAHQDQGRRWWPWRTWRRQRWYAHHQGSAGEQGEGLLGQGKETDAEVCQGQQYYRSRRKRNVDAPSDGRRRPHVKNLPGGTVPPGIFIFNLRRDRIGHGFF